MNKDEKRDEFEKLSRPLIKFLNDNYHPMTHIVIDCSHAELSEGLMAFETAEYWRD